MLSRRCPPLRSIPAAAPVGLQPVAPASAGLALQSGVVALVLALSCLSALASLPRANPGAAEPFALVFPPWTSAQAAAEISFAAGFSVLRGGAWPFVTIVTGPDAGPAAVLPGAVLALKLSGLAGCLDAGLAPEATP